MLSLCPGCLHGLGRLKPSPWLGECNSSLLSSQLLMTAWRMMILTSLKRTWVSKSKE